MDLDYNMDEDTALFPSQHVSSQGLVRAASVGALPSADADSVKWQGSQTSCAALDALMTEAAQPVRRRELLYSCSTLNSVTKDKILNRSLGQRLSFQTWHPTHMGLI